jgi:hypothetical protein
MRALILAGLAIFTLSSGASAQADTPPANLQGTWSARCGDARSPALKIAADRLEASGTTFRGVDVSHTYIGGSKASGGRTWLLVSVNRDGPYAFVAAIAKNQRSLTIEEGAPEARPAAASLIGKRLALCR